MGISRDQPSFCKVHFLQKIASLVIHLIDRFHEHMLKQWTARGAVKRSKV